MEIGESSVEVSLEPASADLETSQTARLDGVGRLKDVIGADEAKKFFSELRETREFLYGRAIKRWGNPAVRQGFGPRPGGF